MIKMLRGTFGLPINGTVKPITSKDGPFQASPEQEERLVRLGLAVRVDDVPASVANVVLDDEEDVDIGPIGFDETPPEEDVEAEEIIDLSELSAKELREIGKEYGLSFKANASKASMIEAIEAAQAENEGDEPAEDAPEFDASEAVL